LSNARNVALAGSRRGDLASSNFRSSSRNHECGPDRRRFKPYCDVSMFGSVLRKRSSNRFLSTIHSENLRARIFRLVVPRCRIGSRIPATSLPWAVSCGVFPSTTNFDRLPSGKRQRRMIFAVKDRAWLIQTLSIVDLDQRSTFGALGGDADKGTLTGMAGNA
jgi:hypothetical protein